MNKIVIATWSFCVQKFSCIAFMARWSLSFNWIMCLQQELLMVLQEILVYSEAVVMCMKMLVLFWFSALWCRRSENKPTNLTETHTLHALHFSIYMNEVMINYVNPLSLTKLIQLELGFVLVLLLSEFAWNSPAPSFKAGVWLSSQLGSYRIEWVQTVWNNDLTSQF